MRRRGSGRSLTNVSSSPETPVSRCPVTNSTGVDDVRADVAERARSGLLLVQTPGQRGVLVGQPVLQVLRPDLPDRADRAVRDHRLGQGDRRRAAVGEAHHGLLAGRRPRRRRPSAPPGEPCWPAVSRRAHACRRRGPPWRSPHACCLGCRCRPGRCRRAPPPAASRCRCRAIPCRAAAAATASADLPTTTAMSGCSGRSATRPAVRHACECAAPMNAYPIIATRRTSAPRRAGAAVEARSDMLPSLVPGVDRPVRTRTRSAGSPRRSPW